MRARIRTVLRAAIVALVALESIYLLAAHLALNTPLGTRAFNRKPERFHIGWRVALTPWPGFVHLRGVETGGMSRTIQWSARVASVSASFRVRPIVDRVVELGTVRADGIEYAQRPRLDPGATPPPEAGEWPVFEGVSNPPEGPGAGIGPPRPPRAPWTVRAERIRGTVDGIWIGRYRLRGRADLDARLDLVARGAVALPRLEYHLPRGDLLVGEERMFDAMRFDVSGRLDPFTPRGRAAADVIRSLSGRFNLYARDSTLKFLEIYFTGAQGLRLDGGGPMRLTMLLDRGRLLEGSRFDRGRDRIDTTFLESRVRGTGTIRGEVRVVGGVPTSRVEALIEQYDVTAVDRPEAHARGRGFHVVAESTSLDLADPFTDLRLTVDLPEAEIHDLSFYNRYLPPDARLAIVSGVGRLTYHFEGDSITKSLRGTMNFGMHDLALRFEETTLTGDIDIAARLRSGEPRARRFDIGGTRISLRHRSPPWRGVIVLPEAEFVFSDPMQVSARVGLDLQDTVPLVRVFDAYKDVSKFVQRLMTIEDVRGGARIEVDERGVDLRDVRITGDGLRALAEMSLADAGREGVMYLRFHGISFGVRLEPGKKRDYKIVRPLAWYERERAARRAARSRRATPGPPPSAPPSAD